jgi:RimJ/RimL family protein N-acetyltransferase
VLRTERLLLAGVTANDRDGWFASLDDEVMHWQGFDPDGLERQFDLARLSVSRFGIYREQWCVARTGDYAVVGVHGVTQSAPDVLETGGWLRSDARGLGYGSEIARAVTAFAHAHLGFTRVNAGTETSNERALRQYRAAGFSESSQGPHRLPNGRTISCVWLEHAQAPTDDRCPHRTRIDSWLAESGYSFPMRSDTR